MSRPGRVGRRRLPTVLLHAVGLVWRASPSRVALLLGVQLLSAASLFASVLLIDRTLDAALLIDRDEAPLSHAVVPVVLLSAVAALTAVATAISTLQQRVLGGLVERAVWREILDVTGNVDLRTYDDPGFYDQAARVEERAGWQTRVVVEALLAVIGHSFGIIAGTVALLALAPLLAPFLVLAGVPLLITSRLAGRREFGFVVEWSPPHRERLYLEQVLTGRDEAKEVRAYSLSTWLQGTWEGLFTRYLEGLRRHVGRLTRLTIVGATASAVLTGAAMVMAVVLVGRGDLDVAEAGAALVAVRLLGSRVGGLSTALSQVFEASLFLEDLDGFRERARERGSTDRREPAPSSFEEIRVSDVTFTYPDAPQPAVDHVSLRIRRGEVVALVGENGSGKTTLAKLIAHLYAAETGVVHWDGVDVRAYDPDSVRRRIAVLFQDFIRYRLTARANIALGRAGEDVDECAIEEAAIAADAHTVLSALPNGYSTVLSKEFTGGTELSLGQWQRVALSRALLRNAPLVVLDEPSASLDARAEHELFLRMREMFAGRAVLMISHRLSTVRSADRIYVLSGGRIVEEGTHLELLERRGTYARLFDLQARGYGLGSPHETEGRSDYAE